MNDIRDEDNVSLNETIEWEVDHLLKELNEEIARKTQLRKYLSQLQNALKTSSSPLVQKLLSSPAKDNLLVAYPDAKETIEKLSILAKRGTEGNMQSLQATIEGYCTNNGLSFRGRLPKITINHLLEIEIDEKTQTCKVGSFPVRSLDWTKILPVLEREQARIWARQFAPQAFLDRLLRIHARLLISKPNPVGWIRLEDVYQMVKAEIQREELDWRKGGRLVAYYKDEFSADLSKLWEAQMNQRVSPPHIEFSGIRNPRLSYKIILPDGQTTAYGHMRPTKEGN